MKKFIYKQNKYLGYRIFCYELFELEFINFLILFVHIKEQIYKYIQNIRNTKNYNDF